MDIVADFKIEGGREWLMGWVRFIAGSIEKGVPKRGRERELRTFVSPYGEMKVIEWLLWKVKLRFWKSYHNAGFTGWLREGLCTNATTAKQLTAVRPPYPLMLAASVEVRKSLARPGSYSIHEK